MNDNPQIYVFLFLDALGWDIVEPRKYLADILPYRKAMEMQFGYSCTAIPTILSGKRPAEHGHLSLFRFAPQDSPFRVVAALMRCLKPASFWRRGRIRNQLSKLVKKILGFTGYFQLYAVPPEKLGYLDYGEKKNLFTPGGLSPVENLAERCERSGVKFHITDWRKGESVAFPAAEDAIRDGAQFLFVYAADLDAIRHDEALLKETPRIDAKLAEYRRRVESLVAALKATGKSWSLTVFSDHGMTPLTKTIDLKSAVEATGLVFGRDYGCCYDSTLFRVTYLKPEAKAEIEKAVAAFGQDGHWLSEEEQKKNGLYRTDHYFGDGIFLVNPGIQIVPSDMGVKPLNGMHGFDPLERHSLAAVMSTDPIPESVRGVYDYYSLMDAALARLEERKGSK